MKHVFDVSTGHGFYGKGNGYFFIAGMDASRALACMNFEVSNVENPTLEGLEPRALEIMQEWHDKLMKKYPIIGTLV